LIDPTGQPGASNRPPDAAQTTCHTVTLVTANWALTAAAAAVIAARASAHTDPAGSGDTGSQATSHNSRVNQPRTASIREPNRVSQPRTVPNGRSSQAAIGRAPNPAALAASAAPITATASARRASTPTGSSTCVARHPQHRVRRGRNHTRPDSPRIIRRRACPHPASTSPQPGQANPPATNRRSTSTASSPTVNIRCLRAPPRGPPGARPKDHGRAAAHPNLLTVMTSSKKSNPPGLPSTRSSPSTTPTSSYVLIQSARGQRTLSRLLVLGSKPGL